MAQDSRWTWSLLSNDDDFSAATALVMYSKDLLIVNGANQAKSTVVYCVEERYTIEI